MRCTFISSWSAGHNFPPPAGPEFAFWGRSNVGKSTLINALYLSKLARTSRTPGRTQLVNFFGIKAEKSDYIVADLPGYGYARAPKNVRSAFSQSARTYLSERTSLVSLLLLIDVRHGLTEEDQRALSWLTETPACGRLELAIVGTKADKLNKSQLGAARVQLARDLKIEPEVVFLVSAQTGLGLKELRGFLNRTAAASPT